MDAWPNNTGSQGNQDGQWLRSGRRNSMPIDDWLNNLLEQPNGGSGMMTSEDIVALDGSALTSAQHDAKHDQNGQVRRSSESQGQRYGRNRSWSISELMSVTGPELTQLQQQHEQHHGQHAHTHHNAGWLEPVSESQPAIAMGGDASSSHSGAHATQGQDGLYGYPPQTMMYPVPQRVQPQRRASRSLVAPPNDPYGGGAGAWGRKQSISGMQGTGGGFMPYSFDQVDLQGLFPGEREPDELGKMLQGFPDPPPSTNSTTNAYKAPPNAAYALPENKSAVFKTSARNARAAAQAAAAAMAQNAPTPAIPVGGGGYGGSPTRKSGRRLSVLEQTGFDKLKDDAIEVASFLREVESASTTLNSSVAARKPEPVPERHGRQRRTESGTVYPVPGPFEENSNVGIGNVFPRELAKRCPTTPRVSIDLEQFFQRCPIFGNITCLRWAGRVKGEVKSKKGKVKEGKEKASKKFDHCCFVSMCLEDGFNNVSVKVFCTGRLQTTGCRDGAMSLMACRKISEAMRMIGQDAFSAKYGLITGDLTHAQGNRVALEAPNNVRLEKESVLGVFDLGFREKGFSVNMEELRLLLIHPDNQDRIYKINIPHSDEKKKVDRFQGIGVYVNKDFLGSPNNVFVSIFPTGKCTVTAAPSVATANKVTEVIGKLVVDLFVQCRKRDMHQPPAAKRQRTKKIYTQEI